jgi:hypothetical protein
MTQVAATDLGGGSGQAKLHDIIQICMGWADYHRHEFDIGGEQYGTTSAANSAARFDLLVRRLADG